MDKLGIAKIDLLNELKEEYRKLREEEASLIKSGHVPSPASKGVAAAIKNQIDELEKEDGGSSP